MSDNKSFVGTVAVIGSGKMGGDIATVYAMQGYQVLMFDMKAAVAETNIKNLVGNEKHPLKEEHLANFKFLGANDSVDREKIKGASIIHEAVFEDPTVKQQMFGWVHTFRDPKSYVCTNTSSIDLNELAKYFTPEEKSTFTGVHFHQPVWGKPAVEMIKLEGAEKPYDDMLKMVKEKFGATIIEVPNVAGFASNGQGTPMIAKTINAAIKHDVNIQEADVVMKAAGLPMGIFGVVDYIGTRTSYNIAQTMHNGLPEGNSYSATYTQNVSKEGSEVSTSPQKIFEALGSNNTQFYKYEGFKKTSMVDLNDLSVQIPCEARPKVDAAANAAKVADTVNPLGLNAMMETDSKYGRFTKEAIMESLLYHASMVPSIAYNPIDIDTLQKSGWSYKRGSFQMIDEIGADKLVSYAKEKGIEVPKILETVLEKGDNGKFYRYHDNQLQVMNADGNYVSHETLSKYALSDVAPYIKPIIDNKDARVFVMNEIMVVDFKTKGNNVSAGVLDTIQEVNALGKSGKYKGAVFGNGEKNFAVGADLNLFLAGCETRDFKPSNDFIQHGQEVFSDLQHANFPKVFTGIGMALGGGAELTMHCDSGVVGSKFVIGLVENKVGLIPGWGGTEEILHRLVQKQAASNEGSKVDPFLQVMDYLANNTISKDSKQAKEMGFLNEQTKIMKDEKELLPTAIQQVRAMAENYQAPEASYTIQVPIGVKAALSKKIQDITQTSEVNAHQKQVLEAGATLLGSFEGKSVTSEQLREKAREIFSGLVSHPAASACIQHTMKTGERLPTDQYPAGSLDTNEKKFG